MKKEGAHTKRYNSDDILRYLQGSLSASEMHQVEKAALEDPFLADAIAGMEKRLRSGGSPEADLKDLHKKLATRIRQKNPVRYFSWRAAAASVLLAGTAALTYYYISDPGRKESALVKVEQVDPANLELQDTLHAGHFSEEETTAVISPARPSPAQSDATSQQGKIFPVTEPPLAADSSDIPPPALISAAIPSRAPDTETSVPVSPWPGDSIRQHEERRIATQLEGRAAGIVVDRSSQHRRETLSMAEAKAARADSGEPAIAGYGLAKKTGPDEILPGQRDPLAEPIGGWKQWQEYINRNKKTPPQDVAVAGIQTLSFIVHKNGKLTDFRIIHSLSPWHDAEAIRLIQQGPAWKVLKGKKQVSTITITFSEF